MANDKNFKVKNGLDVGLEATIGSTLSVTGESTLASAVISDLTSGRVVLAGTNGSIEDNSNLTFDGTTLGLTGNQTVSGTLDVDGQTTLASANIEDLTSGRVVLAGTSGELEDNANLTFNGTTLSVTGTVDASTSLIVGQTTITSNATTGRTVTLQDASGTLAYLTDITGGGQTGFFEDVNVNNSIIFEGTTNDNNETSIVVEDPTVDRTITFPDATGTVALLSSPTITLTGAVTGSGTMTDLGSVSIATTATSDPTLNINGDASGTATFTNLGDATLTLTIADDSHNHTVANIDNFTENVQDIVGGMVSGNTETGLSVTYQDTDGTLDFALTADPTLTLTGDASGTATFTNLGNASLSVTIDGGNADTLDGIQGSAYLRSNTSDTFTGTLTMSGNILPNSNNTRNLGSGSLRWNTVYSTVFDGTATRARYADLAEIYKTDKTYEPGTVVEFGGDFEVTETTKYATTRLAGVISTDPAFLMNKDADGQAIALKGRVPCKVVGPVRKGDMLIASDIPGVAIASSEWIGGAMIGKSIEDNTDQEIKIVEVAVGVL